jgi:serine/threonine-protein kinase
MADPEPKESRVREGDVLAGKYLIERILGVGGTGEVVAARHLQLDAPVAIKFLLPEALANAEAVARFDREARAAVQIKSEHVAHVLDVGVLESGAPYMVMEYLDGSDMEAWLIERGPLPTEQAVEFVLQACEAVAEAHTLGIVHRDLKPANLFVIRRPDGVLSVKVLDFGISKHTALDDSGSRLTRTAALVGTPFYMSPEQMQSSAGTDTRADIWALGVILYELLTGEAPFKGESMPQLALQVVSSPAPALRDKRPDAPEGLEYVILRCLEKEPAARFADVADLARALVEFGPPRAGISFDRIQGVMRSAGVSSTPMQFLEPPPSVKAARPAKPSSTPASWGHTSGVMSSPGKAWFAGAAVTTLLAMVAGIAGYAVWSGKSPLGRLPVASGEAQAAAPPSVATSAPPSIATSASPSVATSAPQPVVAEPPAPEVEATAAPEVELTAAPEVGVSAVTPDRPRPKARPELGVPRVARARRPPAPAAIAPPVAAPPTTAFPSPRPTPSTKFSVYDDRK